jgi:hypothetical protein
VAAVLAGCGSSGATLYISQWRSAFTELQVGQEAKLTVELSQTPADRIYVDVKNDYPDLAEVDPMTLQFKDVDKREVRIKAKKPGKVKLVFSIRDTTESREFSFTVLGQATPDLGPAPPPPDKGTPKPDTAAPKPDTTAPKPG